MTDEQLQTELRALREAPSERFAAELDAWAAAGFPAMDDAARSTVHRRRPGLAERLSGLRMGRLLPVMGAAAALVVIAVAVSSLEESQDLAGPESATVEESQDLGAAGREGAGDAAIEPAPTTIAPSPNPAPPQDGELKPGKERVQERSASMTLSTEPDEVDDVADGVVEVTERYEGIVVSSNVSTSDGRGRASFDLRIPSANLQAALADLSDLASVSARDEGTLDITAPFVTAEERFQDAKAEVDALLDQLAEADSATEIASLREQLQIARAGLAAARSELGALKQRADFSRLSLAVVGDGDADGWSIGDAADDAVDVLEDLAGAGLVALAVIVPLGAIAIAVWFGFGALRRRQREKALDE